MSFSCPSVASTTVSSHSSLSNKKVLNRAEAEQRLRLLSPGTEEYFALQEVLTKSSGIAEVCLGNQSYKVCTLEGGLPGGFGPSEHFFIGREIELLELPDSTVLNREGVAIDFGHIVALAGDFYGVAGQPVSLLGGELHEKEARFMAAFSTIEHANPSQAERLRGEVEKEYHNVRNSCAPHHCYASHLIEASNSFKAIKEDVGALLEDNSDHFGENARETYLIGHSLACREAAEAGRHQDKDKLKRAYALEAFACHFLTDLFAAGHIRNQRGPLELFLRDRLHFSPEYAKSFAAVLTGSQHEYDGERGLEVSSPKGGKWRTYGDGFFFTPQNAENQKRAIHAVQESVNEVFNSYKLRVEISTRMTQYIPTATSFNHLPIYEIKGDELFIFPDEGVRKIEGWLQYLLEAVPLAVTYLREDYVRGFVKSAIYDKLHDLSDQFPGENITVESALAQIFSPIFSPKNTRAINTATKIFAPLTDLAEQFMGEICHIQGIASYAQVKAQAVQAKALAEEMMATAQETYRQGNDILIAVEQLQKQVEGLCWESEIRIVRGAISEIRSCFLMLSTHFVWDSWKRESIGKDLYKASFRLAEQFMNVRGNETPFYDRSLLAAYSARLPSELLPEQRKIQTTRWFRQIIEYQVKAFGCYLKMQYLENSNPYMAMNELRAFESMIERQLVSNSEFIVSEFIYKSDASAALELEKIEARAELLALIEKNSESSQI